MKNEKNDKQMTGTNDRTKKRQNQMTKKRQSKRQNKYFHVYTPVCGCKCLLILRNDSSDPILQTRLPQNGHSVGTQVIPFCGVKMMSQNLAQQNLEFE